MYIPQIESNRIKYIDRQKLTMKALAIFNVILLLMFLATMNG